MTTKKPTPLKGEKKIKAWAVLNQRREWVDQVTSIMSPSLRKFYKKSKHVFLVPATITYSLPNKDI